MTEPASWLCASLSGLPGESVPAAVREILRRRELQVIEAAPGDAPAAAFPLIWVGQRWDEGLARLQRLEPLELRARCVLMGRDPPPDIGPRLRAIGALTYAREDFPGWLVRPIRAALERLRRVPGASAYALLHALRGSKPMQEAALLDAIERLGADVFRADRVALLVRKDASAPVCVLSAHGGTLQLVPWQEQDLDAFDPTPLFDAVEQFGDQVALPSLADGRAIAPAPALWGGAAARRVELGPRARTGAVGPQLRAALLLLWRESFLMNPVEVAGLDALALMAGAVWTHLTHALSDARDDRLTPVPAARSEHRIEPRQKLLRAVAQLAGVPGALLVLSDLEEAPARLHFAGEWFAAAESDAAHRDLYCARPDHANPGRWREILQAQLTQLGSALQVIELLLLPGSHGLDVPAGAVLLVGREPDARVSSLSFLLRVVAAGERLCSDWRILEAQGRILAEAAFDRFHAAAAARKPWDTRAMLAEGAKLVAEVIAAEQIFLQYGREIVSYPALEPTTERICASETSLTRYVQRSGAAVRVLDSDDAERAVHGRLDHVALAQLADGLGWQRVRSLIICPIGDGVGLLKLATSERGAFLTAADATLVSFLANKLGQLAVPSLRGEALKALNELANGVARLAGQQLVSQLVAELEGWSARFIRPHSQIFLLARDAKGSVFLKGVSSELPAGVQQQLEQGATEKVDHGHIVLSRLPLAPAGTSGELALFHRQRLPGATADYLADATREISLLLNAEYVRHELRKQIGIFRHELVGPIQGLSSNTKQLQRELQKSGPLAPELEVCLRGILKETYLVHQWQNRHRLFANYQDHGRLDVRMFRGELRPFVQACVKRFESALAERNLTLRWELPKGGVQADYDSYALDIALSNLLDNAIKYAFYNREITVGLQRLRKRVHVWVEDIGHGIPAARAEEIYLPGGRAGQQDPLRVIHGEGLGLFIAREIARAHDGDLTHQVKAEGHEGSDKTPYRVRFTLTLEGG